MREPWLTRETTIVNANGLHARPAGRLAALARRFDAEIRVGCDGRHADATSILSLLALAATSGRTVEVGARGPDADRAVDAFCKLIEAGFAEEFEEV